MSVKFLKLSYLAATTQLLMSSLSTPVDRPVTAALILRNLLLGPAPVPHFDVLHKLREADCQHVSARFSFVHRPGLD